MSWQQAKGHDEHHEVWILTNDKGELLARIEGFGMNVYYPWVMDVKEPGTLRRIGPVSNPLDEVKTRCESILSSESPQHHDTAGTDRAKAYRGEEIK